MSSGSDNFGAMMTLSQLAALSPNARPSGETVAEQAARILDGINSTLLNTSLATAGLWQAPWIGLTPDGANLCYIAVCPTQNAFAVCCRGTQFNSLVDLGEDLGVGTLAQFTPNNTPLLVSKGSMKALAEATSAPGLDGDTLLEALTQLLADAPTSPQPTVYVTGHSLGGAMATMLAVYLFAQTWTNAPAFAVYTFAAPSAGLQSFASYFDTHLNSAPNQAFRVYNAWDAVPYAWAALDEVKQNFYPSPTKDAPDNPGPAQTLAVKTLLGQVASMSAGFAYTQTNGNSPTGPNTTVLNSDYQVRANAYLHTTTADFLAQVGFQHNCYLQLLKVKDLPAAGDPGGPPKVKSIAPNNGPAAGETIVTITGGDFTGDCKVDFGAVPGVVIAILPDTITVIQPPGTGTVDVRVTNRFGTSAVTSADQFAAPPPAAPTVSTISPTGGPKVAPGGPSYVVTVTGTGFVSPSSVDYTVSFGAGRMGTAVNVLSLTELEVVPPSTGSGTQDVLVTNVLGTSVPAPPGDQFTFGTPIVTGVSPSRGPAKSLPGKMPVITVSGVGFAPGCTVQFKGDAETKTVSNPTIVNETTITVTPPDWGVVGGDNVTVDVRVTNINQQVSAITPAGQYIYYAI